MQTAQQTRVPDSGERDGGRIAADHSVVIVGAGAGGIAAAVTLKDAGVSAVVLEKASSVASSWRARYDRLRLNTSRIQSHLPGRPFPKGTPMFPSRDDLVAHLERHAAEDGVDIRFGTRVERIERDADRWLVHTSGGAHRAPEVIVATAYESEPVRPEWPGRERFAGRILHSCEYRNPIPFEGDGVLVVGPGCSGMEIAYDLATGGAAKVWLAARTPPNILLRRGPAGIPGDIMGRMMLRFPARVGDGLTRVGRKAKLGDLTEYGLPVPEEGVISRLRRIGAAPAIVDEEVIDAVRDGRIEVVAALDSLDATGVRLADGRRVEPDAVIGATGFRRGLEALVGHLDVLDESGAPRVRGAAPAAPGLRFIGYVPRPGGLGYMGTEARRAAKAIRRELRVAG
jgi:cation diffusion facilitator CzcD-associated flavoprotein CzcO